MLRTIVSLILSTLCGLVVAQDLDPNDPKYIARHDSGGNITVLPKGDGKAELVISDIFHSQGQGRPKDSLYCLAKVGKGWPGNKDNDRFDITKMPCGVAKDRTVRINYQWPGYEKGLVDTVGYVPITVHPDGRLYSWEQKPNPKYPDQNEQTYFKSRITGSNEKVISLHLTSTGMVIQALPEEAKLLKD